MEVEVANIAGNEVFYLKTPGVMVMETSSASTPKSEPKKVKKELEELDGVAPWGTDNLFPQNVVKDIERSDLLPTALEKKSEMLYSGGLVYGINTIDDNGNESFKPIKQAEIDDWLEETNSILFNSSACSDHFTYYNLFVKYALNLDRSKIARMSVSDACMTRLGIQDKNGKIKKAYVNANWDKGRTSKDKDTLAFDALDPYYNVAEQIRASSKHEFILPIRVQKRNRIYYELAPYDAIRNIGWLDVAYYVPQFKKFLMTNQMTLKHIVKIDEAYWAHLFGVEEWKKMPLDKAREKKKEVVAELLKSAKGNDKSGGALILPKVYDQEKGEYKEFITVEPLKQMISGGDYNEDSQEADFHIVRSVGLNPTLVGITPGKGNNSGSGSDQRVARNNFVLDNRMNMERVLQPYNIVSEYNGWNKKYGEGGKLTWMFRNYYTATLNSGGSVQTNIEKANGDS